MSIVEKAMSVATQLMPESWLPGGKPDPLIGKHGAIGQPVTRLDGPLKVAGKARFAAEVPLPNVAYAALVFSTIARGRIAAIDTEAAAQAPGVVLVMDHRNAPRLKEAPRFGSNPRAAFQSSVQVLQGDEIFWNGQPVALVLAETQEQANHAAGLIEIRYEQWPATTAFADARRHAHPPPKILREETTIEIGDAEAALASAAVKVDRTFRTPRHNHNAIELHACTVVWEGDELTIHDASQLVTAEAFTMAAMFGLPPEKVRVLSPYVGGGFGGKCLWYHQPLAAMAAKLANRPVRLTLSREGVYRAIGGRTQTEQRVALGANPDGTLASLIHTGVAAMTGHNMCPEQFSFPARHLYAATNLRVSQDVAEMDMIANTFMRAPGESIGTFALEVAIDELAEELGLDPIELRRRIEPDTDPTSGAAFSHRAIVEAYAKGAARFGWSQRGATPGQRREGEWRYGMGVATATYPYYRMPGGGCRITIRRDGSAEVAMASQEMGMGTATVQAQVAADRLGLPFDQVRFAYGDTRLPPGTVAGGSSQTATIGMAVIAAYGALVPALLKLAGNDSPLAGLKGDEVEARDGGLGKIGDASTHERYTSILARAARDEVSVEVEAPPPLEQGRYSMHSYGAQFCEVKVSAITGEVRVTRFLGSFDCGRILNPKTAASQFRGGIIMGLGLALMEETLFDERSGRIVNPSLAEYHVPVHLDVPAIDVIWTDIPDPHAPMGARGIGEIGITGVGAAVSNAVYNAIGRRVRELPITLDKLM